MITIFKCPQSTRLTPDQNRKSLKILNFGELTGAPYSGNNHSGGGSDSESDQQVKSLMELQQQGMPGYGLYRSHYDNPNAGFPGNRGHLGGYPFPPMPGQNSYPGYPHLGYPSSQSPGPREGKRKSMFLFLTIKAPALSKQSLNCIEIQTGIKATYSKVPIICNYANFVNYPFSWLTTTMSMTCTLVLGLSVF